MASLDDAEEALQSTNEKANHLRLVRLLMCGGVKLLGEKFDSIHSPADLPLKLSNAVIQTQLRRAKLTALERRCLHPFPGVYGKSIEFDITLIFKLLRKICNLTLPGGPKGWDKLPKITDLSLKADLARIKYYRNKVYAHWPSMKMSPADFVRLWNDIRETLLRIAANIGPVKSDEWKKSINDFLHNPLTPEEKQCVEELKIWYQNDRDLKAEVEKLAEMIGQ